ncbi:hypothetical protein [Algimonas arctica]|nr:hypothetical protein [Algimonas arctica]
MTHATRYKIRNSLVSAAILLGTAGIASAGAPGMADNFALDRSVMLISPDARFDPAPQLSPAEIRNAVSVRMDSAAEQGFEVDRASVDGIGLEQESKERLVEAPLR